MFDWQAETKAKSSDSNEETEILSGHFWIYWAVSVPLTVVVLLTWRVWWHREKNRYQHKYPHIKLGSMFQDAGWSFSNGLTMIWGRQEKTEDLEMN
jgi:heme/copper-type cytochrome/quinol oxidase subunit 2